LGGKALPLVVILGPTAVGKTEMAIGIAQAVGGEIVSADSRQIYRYMDIGTAKPSLEQRKRATHHLIDIVNPDENLTVARFQRQAYEVINNIHLRDRIPFLVGGTGQYLTAVIDGWSIPEVPPNDMLRIELEMYASRHGSEALHRELVLVDPVAAARIDHQNVRRVVRALEVYHETGQPISALQQKNPPPYKLLCLGLTLDRETLYQRADRRVDNMIEAGLIDEVRLLLDMGYSRHLPAMHGIGYAQLVSHLVDGMALEEAVAATKRATHDFIRRQYTWFRGHDRGIVWHNMQESNIDIIRARIDWWFQEIA
jgi:tRNA dimethylallyltransferase